MAMHHNFPTSYQDSLMIKILERRAPLLLVGKFSPNMRHNTQISAYTKDEEYLSN